MRFFGRFGGWYMHERNPLRDTCSERFSRARVPRNYFSARIPRRLSVSDGRATVRRFVPLRIISEETDRKKTMNLGCTPA